MKTSCQGVPIKTDTGVGIWIFSWSSPDQAEKHLNPPSLVSLVAWTRSQGRLVRLQLPPVTDLGKTVRPGKSTQSTALIEDTAIALKEAEGRKALKRHV